MQLHIGDLATDPADVEQDAADFFDNEGTEQLAEVILILGQLDPTEVHLGTGHPRWTPAQMAIITKAQGKLNDWRE